MGFMEGFLVGLLVGAIMLYLSARRVAYVVHTSAYRGTAMRVKSRIYRVTEVDTNEKDN